MVLVQHNIHSAPLRAISLLAFPVWSWRSCFNGRLPILAVVCAVFIFASCASSCASSCEAFSNAWLANPTYTKRNFASSTLIVTDQRQQQRQYQQRSCVLLFHKILGLTDDGDFCLSGINYFDDESHDNSSFSSASAGAALTDNKNDNDNNDDLFGAQQQQLFQFLSPGQQHPPEETVFSEEQIMVDPSGTYGRQRQPQAELPSSHTPTQHQFVADSNTVASPKISRPVTPSTFDINNNKRDETQQHQVQKWLLEMIPTICDEDLVSYAQSLAVIGFHPNCITQCELHYDDLDFLKLLHRRYLFKKIVTQSHFMES